MGTIKKQQPKQAMLDKSATNQQQPQQKRQHATKQHSIGSTPEAHTGSLSYAALARNGNTTAQPRIHNVQSELKGNNITQQQPLDVQSILAQQQIEFMNWQQQLQQQQFLSWL